MTWLLKLAVSNPWALLAIVLAIFSFGAVAGGGVAWKIQGLRLANAQQEFTQYKQDQTTLIQKAKDNADLQREKASKDYAHLSGILDEQINSGAVYRRCVSAGKCGVRHDAMPACTGIRLPATVGTDETGLNAVPIATGTPEAEGKGDQVVSDCARVTLEHNQLQADIEAQPGYSKE